MAAAMWNGKALRRLYRILPNITVNGKKVGIYNSSWTQKPGHFTVKEWNEALQLILNDLQKIMCLVLVINLLLTRLFNFK